MCKLIVANIISLAQQRDAGGRRLGLAVQGGRRAVDGDDDDRAPGSDNLLIRYEVTTAR